MEHLVVDHETAIDHEAIVQSETAVCAQESMESIDVVVMISSVIGSIFGSIDCFRGSTPIVQMEVNAVIMSDQLPEMGCTMTIRANVANQVFLPETTNVGQCTVVVIHTCVVGVKMKDEVLHLMVELPVIFIES